MFSTIVHVAVLDVLSVSSTRVQVLALVYFTNLCSKSLKTGVCCFVCSLTRYRNMVQPSVKEMSLINDAE